MPCAGGNSAAHSAVSVDQSGSVPRRLRSPNVGPLREQTSAPRANQRGLPSSSVREASQAVPEITNRASERRSAEAKPALAVN